MRIKEERKKIQKRNPDPQYSLGSDQVRSLTKPINSKNYQNNLTFLLFNNPKNIFRERIQKELSRVQ